MGVGLLLVHQKSIRKVHWSERSDQKFLDKHWKITVVKKQKKINSGYPKSNGVCLEKQWQCEYLLVSISSNRSSGSERNNSIDDLISLSTHTFLQSHIVPGELLPVSSPSHSLSLVGGCTIAPESWEVHCWIGGCAGSSSLSDRPPAALSVSPEE